jgi:serine/threonine protein kinase
VDIYDVGVHEDGQITYLVMEYLEGQDLGMLINCEHALPVERAVDIMLPVIGAIEAAHKEGIIHRDLKPGNIFLSKGPYDEEHPKVLDFGISKLADEQVSEALTQTGTVLGTPFYMSPEQALGGRKVDERSDQYSLGVILYQCVTGKRPFDAGSMYSILHNIVEGMFVPPTHVNPVVPHRLERVILRSMSTIASTRYPNVSELGAALLPFASQHAHALWGGVFQPSAIAERRSSTKNHRRPAVESQSSTHEAADASTKELDKTDPSLEPFPAWMMGTQEQRARLVRPREATGRKPANPARREVEAPAQDDEAFLPTAAGATGSTSVPISAPLAENLVQDVRNAFEDTASVFSQPVAEPYQPARLAQIAKKPSFLAALAVIMVAVTSWLMIVHLKRHDVAHVEQPTEAMPVELTPVELTPVEQKPVEQKPVEPKAAEPEEPAPAITKPAATESTGTADEELAPRAPAKPERPAPKHHGPAPVKKPPAHVLKGTNGAPVLD